MTWARCMPASVASLWLVVTLGCASRVANRPAASFVCTQVMGVAVTQHWYHAGFEGAVDGSRWQELAVKSAYVTAWADPTSAVWSQPARSACARGADNPERVIMTAVEWDYRSADEWAAGLAAMVKTLRTKYSALRRIEILTGLRGPGNADCGSGKTNIPAIVDEAIARVSAAEPALVRAGPRLELSSCDRFKGGGPYLTGEGNAEAARLVAAHYSERRRPTSVLPEPPSCVARVTIEKP